MKPHQEVSSGYQADFFRTELSRLLDPKHPMVKVAAGMEWEAFETALEQTWHPELGRPGVSTRLMVSLQYLKYVHDLSDEGVLAMWVENPYWQHLSGMKFFEHQAPIEASIEPETMAQALGQGGSGEAIGGDAQGGVEDETDPAKATGEDQRGHHGSGKAREVSNRHKTL